MKIKILINASTLEIGGGIQVAVSILNHFENLHREKFIFHAIITPNIRKNIRLTKMPFTVISHGSPARPIKGYYSRRLIRKIEKDFNPDIVYSIGFPSYVRFKSIELGRYTNPWEFYEDLPWFLLSFSQKLKVFFRSKYRLYWAKKAKFIETQTETAKNAISKKMKLDKSKIFVIHNSINQIFLEEKKLTKRFTNNEKIIFCLAADHPHKNLISIPDIAYQFKELKTEYKCKFILTLPQDSKNLKKILSKSKKLNVEELIKNIGPINLKECMRIYNESSIVLQPSLLEVFSATYIESMYLGCPLVVPDTRFAREICKDGAKYYPTNNYIVAAKEIRSIFDQDSEREELIKSGKNVVRQYVDLDLKYRLLEELIVKIYKS